MRGLEDLILDLLIRDGQAYGLELVAASGGRLKRGSIYVTLGRMEQKGLVTSTLDERPGEGPPRRIYAATAAGRRALLAAAILRGDLPLDAKA